MRIALFAVALLGASSAAAAAVVPAATPRILDAAAVVDFTPDFGGQLFVLALSPVSDAPGLAPIDFQIEGALSDPAFAPVLTVTSDAGGALLSGVMTSYAVGPDGALSLLFDVTADDLSLFGPQVLAILGLGLGSDPLAHAFSVEAGVAIAPAVAPVPLPPSALLLAGALAALVRNRLR
jgi:hypothetical protein